MIVPSSSICLVVLALSAHVADAVLVPSGWWAPRRSQSFSDPFFDAFHPGLLSYPFRRHHHDDFYHPFSSPFYSPLNELYDPFSHVFDAYNHDIFSKLSSQLNRLREQSNQKKREGREEGSFCEYYIEKTPKYQVKEVDSGILLAVDLPHVEKDKIELHFDSERMRITLSAPFEVIQGFHDDDSARDTQVHVEQATENIKPKTDPNELTVIDEEEEEEAAKKAEQNQSVQIRKESSSIQCKISGHFKTTFRLPKNTDLEKISAKFEQEQLLISLPLSSSASSFRAISIQ